MLDTKQTYKIGKFVNELKQYRGRHTEFVSVYIPAGYDIIKIIQHLAQEQGTAKNIKDARTRANVIDSFEAGMRVHGYKDKDITMALKLVNALL